MPNRDTPPVTIRQATNRDREAVLELHFAGLDDGRIVCMGGVRRIDTRTAEIKRMRVSLPYQNRGAGRMLLRRLLAEAETKGYALITLDTTDRQIPARGLYESEGFVVTSEGTVGGIRTLFFRRRPVEPRPRGRACRYLMIDGFIHDDRVRERRRH